MLTDNLEYLTDEERGWREKTADLRLITALDRLAASRARLDKLGNSEELEALVTYIKELERRASHCGRHAAISNRDGPDRL